MEREITLAHGNGGKLTHDLIRKLFLPRFDNEYLEELGDGAVLRIGEMRLVFTTDTHVVKPIFFPGGDIGKLAATGTINDLVVMGARPLFLSVGMIIEEGFSMADLETITRSLQETASSDGVYLVTGDTKVVQKGETDGIFINTSGIGVIPDGFPEFSPRRIEEGDCLIINGTIGDHGVAIITSREDYPLTLDLKSDCCSLYSLINHCLSSIPPEKIKVMRDPTRGGVATTLNEFCRGRPFSIEIDEASLPLREEVKTICELSGYDPLYLANEGKVLLVVSADVAEEVVSVLKERPEGQQATIIGKVTTTMPGKVILKSRIGGERVVDMLVGDMLPRIC